MKMGDIFIDLELKGFIITVGDSEYESYYISDYNYDWNFVNSDFINDPPQRGLF